MKIISFKRTSMPKLAVLATGAVAALLVATINPAVTAQATPPQGTNCAGCHTPGGSVAATTPNTTLAAGAAYTVTLAFTGGSGNSAYAITGGATDVLGSVAAGATRTQAMTAPAVTTTYTVHMRQGVTATTTYTITVGAAVTTPPAATTTTAPPAATTTTTAPPAATTTTTAPPAATTTTALPVATTTTALPVVPPVTPPTDGTAVAGVGTAVIPVGAPDTGAGGSAN